MADPEQPNLTALTVQLLSAYVANNSVPSEELAGLIETTRSALSGKPQDEPAVEATFVPAVSVRKSLGSRDHLISMIDGKPYKTLKRHLTGHGLTPAQYRSRYSLAADYPMVAPGYSETRREVAKKLGLGRKRDVAGNYIPDVTSADVVATADGVAEAANQPAVPTDEVTITGKKPAVRKKPKTARSKPSAVDALMVAEAPVEVPATGDGEAVAAKPSDPKPRKAPAKASADKAPKTPKVARKPRTPKPAADAAPSESAEVKPTRRRGPAKKGQAALEPEDTTPSSD